jgi:hypothetical protein
MLYPIELWVRDDQDFSGELKHGQLVSNQQT